MRLICPKRIRGLRLLIVAALLSAATYLVMPQQMISFGIIHLLSLIYYAFDMPKTDSRLQNDKRLSRIPIKISTNTVKAENNLPNNSLPLEILTKTNRNFDTKFLALLSFIPPPFIMLSGLLLYYVTFPVCNGYLQFVNIIKWLKPF